MVDPRRSEELAHFVTATEEEVSDDDGEEESGDKADLGSQSEESSEEDDLSQDNAEVDPDFRASVKSALGPGALEMDSVSYATVCQCCFTDPCFVLLCLCVGGFPERPE